MHKALQLHPKLNDYLLLLHKWNQIYNLTGIKDVKQSLYLNILDSLSLLAVLNTSQETILDVGTGAGLPGIPLAIVLKDNNFVLLDSNQKKTTFLQHVIISLELKNVQIVQSKIETYKPDLLFSAICARAFAKVEDFVNLAGKFCTSPKARMIAMQADKAKYSNLCLPAGFYLDKLHDYTIELPEVRRCLVIVKKKGE